MTRFASEQIDRELVAADADEMRRLGNFHPERVPPLAIDTFHGVERLSAAVSLGCSFRLVSAALAEARRKLRVYIYNISAEHLVTLFADAKARGVAVRIMFDTSDTRGDEKAKLQALGVLLKPAPSSGRRSVFTVCHQKFVVIDDRIVLLGSANGAGTSIPKVVVRGKFRKGNREWLVRFDSEAMAQWFGAFLHDTGLPGLTRWLADTLEKLPSWPNSRIDELLPLKLTPSDAPA